MLLIVTIATGMIILGKIDYLMSPYYVKDDGEIMNVSDDELSGNEDLQEEFKMALEDVLVYTLKTNCLQDNADMKELLAKSKKELDDKWKNYNYHISYTTEDGKEYVITNTSESVEELLELPIAVNYTGNLSKNEYSKEWRNLYKGKDTDYNWLEVNYLVNEICSNNKKYAAFISEEIVKHLNIYKDNIIWLLEEELGNDIIYEKLYLENEKTKNTNNDTIAENDNKTADKWKNIAKTNPYGLEKEEILELYECIYLIILEEELDCYYEDISIPLAALLGTPKEYNVTFSIKEDYCTSLQAEYQQYENEMTQRREIVSTLAYILFYDIVLLGFVMLALMYICGRRADSDKIHYLAIDKCFVEITIFAELLLFGGLLYYFEHYWETAFYIIEQVTMCVIPIIIMWFMTQFFFSIVRKIKGRQILASSIIVCIIKNIYRFFRNLLQSGKFVMVSVAIAVIAPVFYGIVVLFTGIFISDGYIPWMILLLAAGFLLCSWGVIIWLTYKKTSAFAAIYDGVEKVKAGDIKYQIKVGGSGMMYSLAENINSLSDGLENAVNEMTKSERLKTELISNVSHDIKTPLTSIITYVDLLKKEEVQPEKAKEYIEVLDQKSQRLKYLTEDLFEAAKASSGAMAMELIILDVGSLVNQGIGEFTEKFEKSSLSVKNNVETEQYFVWADGRLLWRVFENILSNVSKYALAGSRVYIDAIEQKETIMLIVKNISAYELNISAEELMERFTRGDRSRNTEGSGLGLNIAESLAELQNGEFRVEIDGDLFKSILILPKVKR